MCSRYRGLASIRLEGRVRALVVGNCGTARVVLFFSFVAPIVRVSGHSYPRARTRPRLVHPPPALMTAPMLPIGDAASVAKTPVESIG